MTSNQIDKNVIMDFGSEWTSYPQEKVPKDELQKIFDTYFKIFPWDKIDNSSVGFDLGCGSGRWAKFILPKVKELYCIEPSKAINVAKKNLSNHNNCKFINSSVHEMPLKDNSMDFGYSLGVLHHISKTQDGLTKCVDKLKPGAPFLMYLYYSFENRPKWYRILWRISNYIRLLTSKFPYKVKLFLSKLAAIIIYYPLARFAYISSFFIKNVNNFPLSLYKDKSFYTMQTDAIDRFGTRLEKRYSRRETEEMMIKANLENIIFSENEPYWCVLGYKKK